MEENRIKIGLIITGMIFALTGGVILSIQVFTIFRGDAFRMIPDILVTISGAALLISGYLISRISVAVSKPSFNYSDEDDSLLERTARIQKFLEKDIPGLHRLIRRAETLYSENLESSNNKRRVAENEINTLIDGINEILDDLFRIMHQTDENSDTYRAYKEAFEIVSKRMSTAGILVFIPEIGKKPVANITRIIGEKTSNNPVGTIIEVKCPGYRYGDQVLREAEVIISKKK